MPYLGRAFFLAKQLVDLWNLTYTENMIKNLWPPVKILVLVTLFCHLSACAETRAPDRFECLNRAIYAFNKKADRYIAKPAAQIYEGVLPKPVRQMVGNFFQNLSEVPNVANDLLQGQFSLARADTARFLLNSTWGIGGLFDVAEKGGIARHPQDFGITLAKWGYTDTTYVVLPLFGPSTVRDGFGKVATYYMGIPAHLKSVKWRNRLLGLYYIDTRASLLKAEPAIDEAVDEYIFVRDAYLQHRQFQINGNQDKKEESVSDRETKLEGPPE